MYKLFKRVSIFMVLLAPFYTTSAQAAAVRIECPVSQVRTEITTPLPSGWWQTPQVGNLQDTKLGSTTLMCGYWAYGKSVYIQMEAPAGANCTPDATGFTCTTPGVVATPPQTFRTGLLALKQTWMVDFDAGTVGGRDGADLWFQAATATERYMTPMNGALFTIVGNRSVNLEGCRNAAGYTGGKINLNQFTAGKYVCVRTNEGRFSQFRVNTAAGPSPGTMEIGFTTWAN